MTRMESNKDWEAVHNKKKPDPKSEGLNLSSRREALKYIKRQGALSKEETEAVKDGLMMLGVAAVAATAIATSPYWGPVVASFLSIILVRGGLPILGVTRGGAALSRRGAALLAGMGTKFMKNPVINGANTLSVLTGVTSLVLQLNDRSKTPPSVKLDPNDPTVMSILNMYKNLEQKKEIKHEETNELSDIRSNLKSILNGLKELKAKKETRTFSIEDESAKDLQKKMEKMEESLEEIKKMMMFTMQSKSSEKSVISTDSNLSSTNGISKEEMEEMLEAHYKRVSMMAFKRESTIIGEIWKLSRGEAMFTEEWLDKFMDAIDGDDRFELIMSDSFYREWAAIMRHFGL